MENRWLTAFSTGQGLRENWFYVDHRFRFATGQLGWSKRMFGTISDGHIRAPRCQPVHRGRKAPPKNQSEK
jgi:hypothetical protein